MSIQPLPSDVIAQIKSSISITSLNGVILELLKNSLDAESTKIEITVDYSRGACIVEDNGLGILPSEFSANGGLGKLHHSSKLSSKTPVYGGTGSFLASLSALSLLTITSHHHMYRSHNTLNMHKTEVISRQIPATPQQHLPAFHHGTRVTVRDLFGSMPVRVKQRSLVTEKSGVTSREWDVLKRNIVSFLLAWSAPVSLVLRDAVTYQRVMFKPPSLDLSRTSNLLISKICNILSQAALIKPEECPSWVSVGASTSKIEVKGCISLIPSATKYGQFIVFGIQPLLVINGQSTLHDEINRLFQNSAFGVDEEEEPNDAESFRRAHDSRYKSDGYTNKELKGAKKGVDRWPMYYINVDISSSSTLVDVDDLLDTKGNSLSRITELLQVMILEFLSKHDLRPRKARGLKPLPDPLTSKSIEDKSPFSSIKTSEEHRRLPLEKSRPKKFDNFGTNVKLPSFVRRNSQQDSPFDGWSRVKSGTGTSFTTQNIEAGSSTNFGPDILRPSSTPLLTKSGWVSTISRTLTPDLDELTRINKSTTHLLSSTGKVKRRPFDDIDFDLSRCTRSTQTPPTQAAPPSHELVPTDDHKDPIIRWLNPITKVTAVVNQRTGFTVPSQKPSTQRLTSCAMVPSNLGDAQKRSPSPWLTSLLKSWQNPIFPPTEAPIPQASCSSSDEQLLHRHHHHCSQLEIDRAFKEQSSGLHGRISKLALMNAEVIAQVDQKFILAVLPSISNLKGDHTIPVTNNALILIDQHAASERVLIESLLQDLCSPSSTTTLTTTPIFAIPMREVEMFRARKPFFETWGIKYDIENLEVADTSGSQIRIRSLPNGIVERCIREPKKLINFLRTEIHRNLPSSSLTSCHSPYTPEFPSESGQLSSDINDQDWLTRINNCPKGLLDMLNSRACRSAIMFNDVLTKAQCETLVNKLAKCAFPFQCAHGRPSLVPAVELSGTLAMSVGGDGEVGGFGGAMRRWKARTSVMQ